MRKILATFVIGGLLAGGVTTTATANDLFLGDDTFAFVPLDFTFTFYGVDYNNIFVGSNGFVTFGGGDTDFSDTLGEFLSQEPRIAPAWDDWSPNAGGQVTAKGDANSMTVTWDGVPSFTNGGVNTFSTTLYANGNIDLTIDSITSPEGNGIIVGLSPGGNLGNPGTLVDFSNNLIQQVPGLGDQAIYETFAVNTDLNGMTISFVPAPGALALLGLAGLVSRRRRRA